MAAEPEPVFADFRLEGSHGYSIWVSAYSERADGKGSVILAVGRKNRATFYRAPALVTETAVRADLEFLGEIDVVFYRSGLQKTIRWPCGGPRETYEPGAYVGTLEFRGEGGYTRASQTSARLRHPATFERGDCDGSGSGEVAHSDLPGARLRGLSFAHGRTLVFQVNKNHPGGRTIYSASLEERRDGIEIDRFASGFAPAGAFSFDRKLRTAALRLSSPFSGAASLRRSPNSTSPLWSGDLAVDFLGRPDLSLAGPGVYVSLVPARLTLSSRPEVEVGIYRGRQPA